jgi:nucleotidyltransferase substrate binding protein (TIGR01987 family)
MALQLDSLAKAVAALERSLNAAHSNMGSLNKDLKDTVRAGVIQNFEVAYEQCWKFIQRWIRGNRTSEDADHPRTRKELFRMAARYALIADPLPWFDYGDARNLTSRTYNEAQAMSVYETAERFIVDAKALLTRLESNND